jgi:hypothetical protein
MKAQRAKPASQAADTALRSFLEAAVACRGDVTLMRARVRVAASTFYQRLSRLRVRGWATTITAVNPRLTGFHEGRALVSLSDCSPEAVARFEAAVVQDAAVLKADRLSGDADYRLWLVNAGAFEATLWLQVMRARPEVRSCRYETLGRLFGDELPGLALHDRGQVATRRRA